MVSIIIPVYNSEKYLNQCIDSILNQTFNDIEVILVDDGSTDESLSIIKSYAMKYNNVICFSQSNKGVSEARNLALNNSNGDFILFVDSDDYLEQSYVEKLLNKAINTNSDIVICGFNRVYDEDIKSDNECILPNIQNEFLSGKEAGEKLLERKIDGYLWNKIFRKRALVDNDFKFESGRLIEDFFPIFKQLIVSKKITFINKALYNYRQRSSSSVHVIDLQRIDDYKYATNNIINYAKKNKLDENKIKLFQTICFNTIIEDYYKTFHDINENFYIDFKKNKLDEYKPELKDILFNKIIPVKIKIKIIAWNFRVFKLIKTIYILKI